MMNLVNILKRPLVTEKSTQQKANRNEYAFEVDRRATKLQIKQVVEKLFNVKVLDVNTLIQHGKYRRVGSSQNLTGKWKKAFVRVKEGQKIEFFEAK
jgi:large subunit ribosomal protein L23